MAVVPLVIKVNAAAVPNGAAQKWNDITTQMPTFTKSIVTPAVGKNIGAIVSGMPTIFARANMFKLALNYSNALNQGSENGLMDFYAELVDEWKGFVACIALDYANISVQRIYLKYSDGKSIGETANIYEPKGAFGNLLFERKALWCDPGVVSEEEKIPFIDVIKYKGIVVGATSPESFLFTSVAYEIKEQQLFVNGSTKKFTTPKLETLKPEQLLQLYGYVNNLLTSIQKFTKYYEAGNLNIEAENITGNLERWIEEMKHYAVDKKIQIDGASVPPVGAFQKPYSILFNYSTELYGEEGLISDDASAMQNPVLFDPRKLLLGKHSTIARIDYGNDAAVNPNFAKTNPIYVLKADILDMPNMYYYFALPLSPLGLTVFGKNIGALVGIEENSTISSRLSAIYDPEPEFDNLKVTLRLVTATGKERTLEEVYTVGKIPILGNDVMIWPNFISKQWNRYFLYSEIPHNITSQCPFNATPFVGDMNDAYFRPYLDSEGNPIYLAKDGRINIPNKFSESIKAKLHVVSDNRVSDNPYKYEIYECNQPFKGIRLSCADKESGYAIIRYSSNGNNLPENRLNTNIDLGKVTLGIDFGSTNTSVAYFSTTENKIMDQLTFKDRKISLFSHTTNTDNIRPALEKELFFFQREEIKSNGIKSILTIHDSNRIVQDGLEANLSMQIQHAVKGGFPCFEKNLPIDRVTDHRYHLKCPRCGNAEIVYDMKWSNQELENAYKTAYLSSLLLHIYAELFDKKQVPTVLKWSYPSSMSMNLLGKYNQIWANLNQVNPINDATNELNLNILAPSTTFLIENNPIAGGTAGGWGASSTTEQSGWGSGASSGWGNATAATSSGWGNVNPTPAPSQPSAPQGGGWGANAPEQKTVNIKLQTDPIEFKFTQLNNDECLSESCSVANYIVNNPNIVLDADVLTLCFDVGGSTTDISAICHMIGPNGRPMPAMVKQNSIRFAAQRVAHATKYSPNIEKVLKNICAKNNIHIQGLTPPTAKPYSADMSPYYFDQVLDRLDTKDLPDFYKMIYGNCPELMSINTYVTGLIMYYAGQITNKLIYELKRVKDKSPLMTDDWRPRINVIFAGKGARIFDWFPTISDKAIPDYYTHLFIQGFGGQEKAQGQLWGPPSIHLPCKSDDIDNVKYEVSKGLAYPTQNLLVPHNSESIEILGEEGFVILNGAERIPVPYDSSITPEMMENIGTDFMCLPNREAPCPKFMEFAFSFYQVAANLFGLKMTPNEFMQGFAEMNIASYIKGLPEFYEAQTSKAAAPTNPFDFIAPIIILEGMKFYDQYLLKGIQKV